MKKLSYIIATFLVAGALFQPVVAQSVDPGISTHNYKHPNKAAKAKAEQKDGFTVPVASLGTVERFSKRQQRSYVSNTPKYAPRASSLVVFKTYTPEKVNINPLNAPANYKVGHTTPAYKNTELANNQYAPDTSTYQVD